MGGEIIQIRDVPTEEAEALRTRAASQNMSLSSYLRELIHEETSRPTMAEVLAHIAERDSIEATGEDIRSFLDDNRAS